MSLDEDVRRLERAYLVSDDDEDLKAWIEVLDRAGLLEAKIKETEDRLVAIRNEHGQEFDPEWLETKSELADEVLRLWTFEAFALQPAAASVFRSRKDGACGVCGLQVRTDDLATRLLYFREDRQPNNVGNTGEFVLACSACRASNSRLS